MIWKSISHQSQVLQVITGDALFLDDIAPAQDVPSRQKSGAMTPPGSSSIGTIETHCGDSLGPSEDARMSIHPARVSTLPPLLSSIRQQSSTPPPASQTLKNSPMFHPDDLDLPMEKDMWFPEGQVSERMTKRGHYVERGMLFPWMTDSEIV